MSASSIPSPPYLSGSALQTVVSVPELLTDFELRQMASFLADFLFYDLETATQCSASWYRRQVGEDVCSISQAIRLRQLTIEFCCSRAGQALDGRREVSESSELWMAAKIGLKFLLAFVVLAGVWLAVCVAWVEGGLR